jgi:hypothetical protein
MCALKSSQILVRKNHQLLMSSITDARLEGGSRSTGVVHTADTTLPGTHGLLVEYHVDLPRIASIARWGLLADVEGLIMVVEGIEQ